LLCVLALQLSVSMIIAKDSLLPLCKSLNQWLQKSIGTGDVATTENVGATVNKELDGALPQVIMFVHLPLIVMKKMLVLEDAILMQL